jgi:hypothetical protein
VEERDLPVILVKHLREILKRTFFQENDILVRYERFKLIVLTATEFFDQYAIQY